MSDLTIIRGNIFTTSAQTIVNTVNCVGVMGAGIALECKFRYPDMFQSYRLACGRGEIKVGTISLHRSTPKWILNFPTKNHWKDPSQLRFIESGLEDFVCKWNSLGIESIAFPVLGSQNGGLDSRDSEAIMLRYLKGIGIPVEIYHFDPAAPDDLFEAFKAQVLATSDDDLIFATGIRRDLLAKVRNALADSSICQIHRLAKVPGIGERTLERVFTYCFQAPRENFPTQGDLGL